MDDGQYACGIFVDLQKAFDTVDHEILLQKLNYYGIRGLPNSWFKSFLTNWKQFFSISGQKSFLQIVENGVPQGSVLGPLLFLLYINDLHNAIIYSSVYHFADDNNILHINKSLKSINKKVNINLKLLCHWLNANKIYLNCGKTEYVLFKSQRRLTNFQLKLKVNGKLIYSSLFIKYLRIFIDRSLSWNKQVYETSLKLWRANEALCKLRHYLPNQVLNSVYYVIFYSHMRYAFQIWGQRQTVVTNRILILKKRAVRIMSFSKYNETSRFIFADMKFLNFFDLVEFLNIILIHDILNSKTPMEVEATFSLALYNRSTITRAHL